MNFFYQFLTADAWVLSEWAGLRQVQAPQKFLLSQKFRHLMEWRNMRKKIYLLRKTCLQRKETGQWSPTLAFLYPLYLHFYELLITSNDFW